MTRALVPLMASEPKIIQRKWNSISATGGVDRDFALTRRFALRRIFNFAAS
jgi:hypothetical protein